MVDYEKFVNELARQDELHIDEQQNKIDEIAKQLQTIRSMCGNPDAADACRLISKRLSKIIESIKAQNEVLLEAVEFRKPSPKSKS